MGKPHGGLWEFGWLYIWIRGIAEAVSLHWHDAIPSPLFDCVFLGAHHSHHQLLFCQRGESTKQASSLTETPRVSRYIKRLDPHV